MDYFRRYGPETPIYVSHPADGWGEAHDSYGYRTQCRQAWLEGLRIVDRMLDSRYRSTCKRLDKAIRAQASLA